MNSLAMMLVRADAVGNDSSNLTGWYIDLILCSSAVPSCCLAVLISSSFEI